MNNNKIRPRQLSLLLAIIIHGAYFGAVNSAFLDLVGHDIFLVLTSSLLLSLIFTLIYYKLWQKEKNISVFSKVDKLCGRVVGSIINLIIIALFFLLFCQTLYNLVDFVSIIYLPKTPFILIALVVAFTIAYAINTGFESIIRLAPYVLGFSLLSYLFLIISCSQINVEYFLPMTFTFTNNKLIAILLLVAIIVLPLFFALSISAKEVVKPQRFFSSLVFGTIGGYCLIVLDLVFTIGFLSVELASVYKYAEFYVLKKIQLFSFVKNMETLLSVRWILDALLVMIIAVKMIKRALITIITNKRLSSQKLAYIICSFGVVFIAIVFAPGASKYFGYYDYYGILVVITLFLITALPQILFFKRK